MSSYHLDALVVSPLALTVRRATGNDVDTQHYIPGTALRGALAAWYLRQPKTDASDPQFQRLFVDGVVRYGCLRLAGCDFWPLSARTCKDKPIEHHVADRLLPLAAGITAQETCAEPVGTARCGAKIEIPDGFTKKAKRKIGGAAYQTQQVITRRVTHSAIQPQLSTTKSGQLFSVRSIEPHQSFQGRIDVRDEESALELKQLWSTKNDQTEKLVLRMGRARSRGQGTIEIGLVLETSDRHELQSRIQAMQTVAHRIGGRLARKTVVSVTLQAPAIVRDEFLLAQSWLSPKDVNLDSEWQLEAWFSRLITVSGWHAAAGVPRNDATALAPGSCFLFSNVSEPGMQTLTDWASLLQQEGIGVRRDEGFGEVRCCHPIHYENAEQS